jgi:hypothetical protein
MRGGWHGQPGWIWKEAGTMFSIAELNGVLSLEAQNVTAISLSCYRKCQNVLGCGFTAMY